MGKIMKVLHSRHEKFKAFAQASGEIFNVTDAAALLELPQTETAKILARWQKQGFIFRVQKGLYVIMPIDTPSQDFTLENHWMIVPKLFGPCYIGGFTAAEHWGLTEQIFNSIYVYTTKAVPHQSVKIANQNFVLKHIHPTRLFGLKPIWFKQQKVMISDIHHTIIDLFDNPESGGGIQHTIDCLKNYLHKPEADFEKLLEYAAQLKNGAIYKRLGYVLSLFLGEQNMRVLPFKQKLTKGCAYLDPKQKMDVRLVRRWNVFVPKALDIGVDA